MQQRAGWGGGGAPEVTKARLRGQEYLLDRRLFRRRLIGEVIERDRKGGTTWTRFAFPTWWHYDVLRGLEYLRSAGVTPDERVAEAIDLVVSKRDDDGRWPSRGRGPEPQAQGITWMLDAATAQTLREIVAKGAMPPLVLVVDDCRAAIRPAARPRSAAC